ncbi:MAG: (Fe-S)-binding protein [Dehalococcoidia bacterium]
MVSEPNRWPRPDDAPAKEDLSRCVHCGLCINSCPTYAITGLETESPRGRIYLARGVDEGTIPLTAAVQGHWDLCLQCRACEAVCPSGVPYGRLMEHVRAQVSAQPAAGGRGRRVRRFVLRNVVARPRVLRMAVLPARMWAGFPLRGLVRRTGVLRRLGRFGAAENQLPDRVGRPLRPGDPLPQPETSRAEVILFTGCVMGEVFGDVHRATAAVLMRSGFAVEATKGQGCCGALSAHDGDLDFARKLARRNIDALEATGDGTIVVNSAGCGAALKEYGDLLGHDPKYADRARRFGARVRDLTEVLAAAGIPKGKFEHRVAYQDACHLVHAQRVRSQPRELLGALSGITCIETSGNDMCCGAAGLYSLVQSEMSAQLRAKKTEQFAKHKPDVVVTANPGCHMQYVAAVREAGIDARVMHIAEVLEEATRP